MADVDGTPRICEIVEYHLIDGHASIRPGKIKCTHASDAVGKLQNLTIA